MPDELVNVRYMVDDVEDAVAFYTTHFNFTVRFNAARAFADVARAEQQPPADAVPARTCRSGSRSHTRRGAPRFPVDIADDA